MRQASCLHPYSAPPSTPPSHHKQDHLSLSWEVRADIASTGSLPAQEEWLHCHQEEKLDLWGSRPPPHGILQGKLTIRGNHTDKRQKWSFTILSQTKQHFRVWEWNETEVLLKSLLWINVLEDSTNGMVQLLEYPQTLNIHLVEQIHVLSTCPSHMCAVSRREMDMI